MKIAIKIFLIMTYVSSGITLYDGLPYLLAGETLNTTDMIFFVSAIIAIPVTILAHVKIDRVRSRSELLPYAILLLLFGNLIAGILMLCISDQALMPKNRPNNPYGAPYQSPYQSPYGAPYGTNTQAHQSPYGAPYGSPYGNPTGEPFDKTTDEPTDEPTDEIQNDADLPTEETDETQSEE